MPLQAEEPKQILIVEDEGIIAADIQCRLEKLGYRVPAIAGSGEEALRLARATAYDLVLMDIRLKGEMDGIATAQTMRTELATPVVYITAHSDEQTIDRATRTEPFGYILKPIRSSELRGAVRVAIHKHEMERRVRASEAWLATTLRSIGEGVIATDPDGKVVFMNPVAEQLMGWRAAEAEGRPLMDVLSLGEESTGAPAKNPVAEILAGESSSEPIRAYTLTSRSDVSTSIELSCFENRSDTFLGAILVLRDIEARLELERRAMQSQRMEAIANLAAGLAHDFNNQLTVMLGCATELCEGLSGKNRERAYEIKHSGMLAAALTGQLLTLSRHQSMHAEPLSLNEVILDIQPYLSSALGKLRALTTKLGPNLGRARADRNQLKQVLLNLTLNARDAMPRGGELRLETSNYEVKGRSPKAALFPPGPYVRMLVADCGEGMDQETLGRIFEPFFTTKKPGFGTGLGLSMVHSIILQSGGFITARSELGLGTVFEILLPRLAASRQLDQPGSRQGLTEGGDAPITVLVVEDEEKVRRAIERYFQGEGYRMLEARNGEEAEVIAREYGERIDMLVTDVMMPGMSGPELARRLEATRPDLQVLYVSGYPAETLAAQGVLDGRRDFLRKPFTARELLERVDTMLAKTPDLCGVRGVR